MCNQKSLADAGATIRIMENIKCPSSSCSADFYTELKRTRLHQARLAKQFKFRIYGC